MSDTITLPEVAEPELEEKVKRRCEEGRMLGFEHEVVIVVGLQLLRDEGARPTLREGLADHLLHVGALPALGEGEHALLHPVHLLLVGPEQEVDKLGISTPQKL